MNPEQAPIGTLIVAASVAGASAIVWLWPRLVRFFTSLERMFETINGRPAEIDKAGRESSPAIPSLSVQIADLKQAVSDQAEQNTRIAAMETTLAEHGKRLVALEDGAQLERLAARADSHQAFKAIEAIANQPGAPELDES